MTVFVGPHFGVFFGFSVCFVERQEGFFAEFEFVFFVRDCFEESEKPANSRKARQRTPGKKAALRRQMVAPPAACGGALCCLLFAP